jgi:nucleoside-diphosphate-sugar epimerase
MELKTNIFDVQMYYMAKTLAEQATLQFGSDHGIEVVTIVPSLVYGPSITPTVPNSIEETLALITCMLVVDYKEIITYGHAPTFF